jgi:hypothetical protein
VSICANFQLEVCVFHCLHWYIIWEQPCAVVLIYSRIVQHKAAHGYIWEQPCTIVLIYSRNVQHKAAHVLYTVSTVHVNNRVQCFLQLKLEVKSTVGGCTGKRFDMVTSWYLIHCVIFNSGAHTALHHVISILMYMYMYIVNCTCTCTLYIVHCTLYIVHCTLYIVHCTLYMYMYMYSTP